MSRSENNRLPLILIGILTIFLLVVFGYEQFTDDDFNKGDVIGNLYSEVFKPLFTDKKIAKEEVLTFAVKGNLTLNNNSNQILQVQKNQEGKEVLRVKKNEKPDTNNYYATLVSELELDEDSKTELDSILELYQGEFSKLVYRDDKSSIAIDPKIALLKKSLNQDLSFFVMRKKDTITENIFKDEKRLYKTLNQTVNEIPREYIVFTPDSIVKREYALVGSEPINSEEIKLIKSGYNNDTEYWDKSNNEISFKIDSNLTRVVLDNAYLENINLDEINTFRLVIDSAKNNVKFSVEISEDSSKNISIKFNYTDSLNNNIKYEMNSNDIGTAFSNSMKLFSGKNLDEWIEYGIEMDSISRTMDSLNKKNNKEL